MSVASQSEKYYLHFLGGGFAHIFRQIVSIRVKTLKTSFANALSEGKNRLTKVSRQWSDCYRDVGLIWPGIKIQGPVNNKFCSSMLHNSGTHLNIKKLYTSIRKGRALQAVYKYAPCTLSVPLVVASPATDSTRQT